MSDEDFCALYDAHARRLWAYVVRATGNAAAADDIVQEAFMRVFDAQRLDRADAEHRRAYLYKVATNLIRRRHRRAPETDLSDAPTASMTAAPEAKLAVERALNTLSEAERQTLWLSYVEGWSHREIARMLGYREGSLRQVAVRAKRRFAAALGLSADDRKEQS
jgi:RNA polymerase sigma-70 factor (ECF subfamily)